MGHQHPGSLCYAGKFLDPILNCFASKDSLHSKVSWNIKRQIRFGIRVLSKAALNDAVTVAKTGSSWYALKGIRIVLCPQQELSNSQDCGLQSQSLSLVSSSTKHIIMISSYITGLSWSMHEADNRCKVLQYSVWPIVKCLLKKKVRAQCGWRLAQLNTEAVVLLYYLHHSAA